MSMYNELSRIWYIYCEDYFYGRKESELSKMLGWQIKLNKNGRNFRSTIDKLYKNHIMIKIGFINGNRISSCETYSLYIANDIEDENPILIYYCYNYNEAAFNYKIPMGWVNIDNWSIFTKKLINDCTNIIKNFEKIQKFNEYIEKEKSFTKNLKPELNSFFNKQILNLDINSYLKLIEDILNNVEFNEYTREQNEKVKEQIAQKLMRS